MKTKSKIASSKKILIASILVGVLLIGSIITVVAVLASQVQNVSSGVTVNYVVSDVGAKVSAKYYVVNPSSGVAAQSVTMTNGSESEIEFGVADSSTTKALTPSGEVNLSSTNSRIIYEYKFTNTTESAFKISLAGVPETVDNMAVTYKSLGSSLSNYATTFSDNTLKTQLLVEKDATVYIYISVQVVSINQPAEYTGNITWKLEAAKNLSTLTLNNGTGTGGQTSIKYLADNAVQLPHLTSVPTSSDSSKIFDGYYTSANGAGTKLYDTQGNSLTSLASGSTIYANFTAGYAVTTTGELMSVASTESTLNIPNTVTTIGTNALSNTTASTINIPNSVTKIGDSALENNTSVTTVNFGDTSTQSYADGSSLTTIGDNAFKGCTNITKLVIPEGVTSIGSKAFYDCRGLGSITIPSSLVYLGMDVFGGTFYTYNYNEYGNAKYLGNEDNPYLIFINPKSLYTTRCVVSSNCKFICNKAFVGYDYLDSTTIEFENNVYMRGWAAYCGGHKVYDTEASVLEEIKYLKDGSNSSSSTTNWGYYTLIKETA